jgi:hypothetical protein
VHRIAISDNKNFLFTVDKARNLKKWEIKSQSLLSNISTLDFLPSALFYSSRENSIFHTSPLAPSTPYCSLSTLKKLSLSNSTTQAFPQFKFYSIGINFALSTIITADAKNLSIISIRKSGSPGTRL